ncbi:tRNA (guanine-N(7)-)-methyltransferase (tRNA(m7G46)-methyltransferase) [Nowakowskiella sp. JEL0407]|nr:tRNA (guanine-N(7)-)-methyltransferase (tRNA(m7G46)-methyltransferase) [Nowakowskiella sp. JEL0407]
MGEALKLPQKRFHRQRPISPDLYNWHKHYPAHFNEDGSPSSDLKKVEIADVGCGFGGLLSSLSPLFPNHLILGMEIRDSVEEYVEKKINVLREQKPGEYQNISVIRSNAMKFLVHFFEKGQLSKIFFLFPDPHFKKRKHKARIITPQLLASYAYVLNPTHGKLYIATDVHPLYLWMTKYLDLHPLFERLDNESDEVKNDVCVQCSIRDTEEGKKVERNAGSKWWAVYKRVEVSVGEWSGFDPIVYQSEKDDGKEEEDFEDEEGDDVEPEETQESVAPPEKE